MGEYLCCNGFCRKNDEKLKLCGSCRSVRYCSIACQRTHWPKHKKLCKAIKNVRDSPNEMEVMRRLKQIQKKQVNTSTLKIDYLNPSDERTIEEHGADTKPALIVTIYIKKLLQLMGLNPREAKFAYADSEFKGTYGKCYRNVWMVIQSRGGKMISGWNLFEGKYLVEAEAHCVWKPPDCDVYVNATTEIRGKCHSGYFIRDDKVAHMILSKGGIPPNKIYWKE